MPRATVVGGGPGGLFAAEVLATAGVEVTVLERMPSVGRKLLLAGRGGLNLTHTEDLDAFLDRYGPARARLEAAIRAFAPDDLRAWAAGLGQPTFVGTSGRVFPEAFRATPLLRAWLRRLADLGVEVRTRTTWTGEADADVTILALGGASWPRVGSDGRWVELLPEVDVVPFRPANCGFRVGWTEAFRQRFAGAPLKNVVLSAGSVSAQGDVVVTSSGIEGGAVYAVSAALRDGDGLLHVDLHPQRSIDDLAARLVGRPKDSAAATLRRAGVSAVGAGLAREATGNRLPSEPRQLAALLKAVPVPTDGPQPIARAISSAGGIALDEVDEHFMLRRRPGTFVCGEMLDWEAPTGGYLLQATFSTARAAAIGALGWLASATWT
jgi:uncharacterized flavoprotein (TIGR03862 family)